MVESTDKPELPPAGEFLDLVPDRWLRRVPGRETFAWPAGAEPILAVKRFETDDRRDIWYSRLRGRRSRTPAEREFDSLVALSQGGFRVPRAVGWTEDRSRRRSVVLMRWVPHRETLTDRIGRVGPVERAAWLAELADLVARFHRAGYYHRDLYLHHFVVADGPGETALTLLDLGRVRRERAPRRRWLIKDLGALAHSLPAAVPDTERKAFFARYFDQAGPDTLAARGRWSRAIERRRRSIAAHVPRHGEEQIE